MILLEAPAATAPEMQALYDFVVDALRDRVAPVVLARANHAVQHPLEWGAVEFLVLGCATQIGLEFYRHGVPHAFKSWEHLPARGKPLEVLASRDRQFITTSQVLIVFMTFHYLQLMASSENVLWKLQHATLGNTLLPLPLFFIVYDAFYAPFHRLLHHPRFYAYVHKHHHRQIVPTRGNTDAINVHPIEFIGGEYMHVLAIFLVSHHIMRIHAIACLLFLVVGGCLATLNHTRLDCAFLRIPFTTVPIFGVRAHDTHHAIPNSNYGQCVPPLLTTHPSPAHADGHPRLSTSPTAPAQVHHALGLGHGHVQATSAGHWLDRASAEIGGSAQACGGMCARGQRAAAEPQGKGRVSPSPAGCRPYRAALWGGTHLNA